MEEEHYFYDRIIFVVLKQVIKSASIKVIITIDEYE